MANISFMILSTCGVLGHPDQNCITSVLRTEWKTERKILKRKREMKSFELTQFGLLTRKIFFHRPKGKFLEHMGIFFALTRNILPCFYLYTSLLLLSLSNFSTSSCRKLLLKKENIILISYTEEWKSLSDYESYVAFVYSWVFICFRSVRLLFMGKAFLPRRWKLSHIYWISRHRTVA